MYTTHKMIYGIAIYDDEKLPPELDKALEWLDEGMDDNRQLVKFPYNGGGCDTRCWTSVRENYEVPVYSGAAPAKSMLTEITEEMRQEMEVLLQQLNTCLKGWDEITQQETDEYIPLGDLLRNFREPNWYWISEDH